MNINFQVEISWMNPICAHILCLLKVPLPKISVAYGHCDGGQCTVHFKFGQSDDPHLPPREEVQAFKLLVISSYPTVTVYNTWS